MSKYHNKKIQVDMYVFDSIAESKRYKELALLQKVGYIQNLELQPKFLLQEGFKKNGKTYRKIEYIADFMYKENGKTVIEDVKSKGTRTEVYKIKKKLFEKKYPNLTIMEIE